MFKNNISIMVLRGGIGSNHRHMYQLKYEYNGEYRYECRCDIK